MFSFIFCSCVAFKMPHTVREFAKVSLKNRQPGFNTNAESLPSALICKYFVGGSLFLQYYIQFNSFHRHFTFNIPGM